MLDEKVLKKYVDLEKSCLSETERKVVLDMLLEYEAAFSLRDKIGKCPSKEVETAITDKSPFVLDHIM